MDLATVIGLAKLLPELKKSPEAIEAYEAIKLLAEESKPVLLEIATFVTDTVVNMDIRCIAAYEAAGLTKDQAVTLIVGHHASLFKSGKKPA